MREIKIFVVIAFLLCLSSGSAQLQTMNGFDLSNVSIGKDKIRSGILVCMAGLLSCRRIYGSRSDVCINMFYWKARDV